MGISLSILLIAAGAVLPGPSMRRPPGSTSRWLESSSSS